MTLVLDVVRKYKSSSKCVICRFSLVNFKSYIPFSKQLFVCDILVKLSAWTIYTHSVHDNVRKDKLLFHHANVNFTHPKP